MKKFISLLLIATLSYSLNSILLPIFVQADTTPETTYQQAEPSPEELQKIIGSYVELDDEHFPIINIEAMNEHNIAPKYIDIAYWANAILQDYRNGNFRNGDELLRFSLTRIYGNWCGLGHTMDDRHGPAIDILDWQCKKHDLCYRDYGFLNIECDKTLIRDLKDLLNAPSINGEARNYASYAYTGLSILRQYWG